MRSTVSSLSLALAIFGSYASAQLVGTNTAENHPALTVSTCTVSGGCSTQAASIVLDANWRWLHNSAGTNCYTGNTFSSTLAPDSATCLANCALDGADYSGTYGITTSGSALTLKFVVVGQYATNIGSRVYLMAPGSTTQYQILKLKNREFTFDVDLTNIGCGLNGALYLVEMAADGGLSQFSSTNKAGAKYGTGYCDAQCPQDLKFIADTCNVAGWTPSTNDKNAGTGNYGSCCNEMDIWEGNFISNAYTPHVCTKSGLYKCTGTDCGAGSDRYNGVCDKDGCDLNPYRSGVTSFFGQGKTVDTTKPVTVVTQWITSDGTDSGNLVEIRRKYVQNGIIYETPKSTFSTLSTFNSVTDAFCNAQKTLFGDNNNFETFGGLTAMGQSMDRGMVLVMSLWDDHAANMLWLDSNYPTTKSSSTPGVARGNCAITSGVPADVEANQASSSVTYSNIKWGEIGSTVSLPIISYFKF
ncbi:hypothetical protein HK096_006923 [Nowakowskiella sp. JEL0078]|nr:hypothetical protein HK096_006923 [Nowakowskiella sp. JEL0078]